jgi:hypothetical protein
MQKSLRPLCKAGIDLISYRLQENIFGLTCSRALPGNTFWERFCLSHFNLFRDLPQWHYGKERDFSKP